jgi:hypothetical protein
VAHRLPVRRTCLIVTACLLAGPGAVAASADSNSRMALEDVAGDANGLNDQGEGLVGNIALGRQVAQADLRRVALVPLPGEDAASGLRLRIRTTTAPAPLADGTPLAYGLVMQPHPDCRIVLEYVSEGTSRTGHAVAERARLIHSCEDGHYQEVPLPASVSGRSATVDVPYALLPEQAQAGAVAHSVAAYVRTAPFGDTNRAKPGQLDGVRTMSRYTFPG